MMVELSTRPYRHQSGHAVGTTGELEVKSPVSPGCLGDAYPMSAVAWGSPEPQEGCVMVLCPGSARLRAESPLWDCVCGTVGWRREGGKEGAQPGVFGQQPVYSQ